jgi:hypothetical protein
LLRFSYAPPISIRGDCAKLGSTSDQPFTPLQAVLPSVGITKHRLRQLEAVQLIRDQREKQSQDLAFHARPFVLCGIALRRPPESQLLYTRRNGKFFLQITGHPQFGLPFGQDRLIPIWVATLALRQRSRTVRFSTAAEMLDFFRLFKDGKRYHRLMEGFQRIFAATIFFGTSDQPDGRPFFDWARFHFFDRLHLWFHHVEPAPARASSPENLIVLSEAFYDEIDQHRIPVEREVVALLANAPGVLDLYIWLVWKTWTLNRHSVRIPLFAAGGLSEQLGTADYSADRFFRRKIHRWLREVQILWPECPANISTDGQSLVLYSGKRNPAVMTGTYRTREEGL